MTTPALAISIVSHGHGPQVDDLLHALAGLHEPALQRVILTLNLPESDWAARWHGQAWPFELLLRENPAPLGFGANHNRAFAADSQRQGGLPLFAVLNPDLQLRGNPLVPMLRAMQRQPQAGAVYPMQVDAAGQPQDHQRLLPTPGRLLLRRLGRHQERPALAAPHWVNAAFIVLRPSAFAAVGGFDPAYRLYCEDVDLCLRLQLAGWQLAAAEATVVHTAARASHRNARHLLWHVQSLWRLWGSEAYAAFRRTRGGG